MTKRETTATEARPVVPALKATRSPHQSSGNAVKLAPTKRKVEEENGVEAEENGVRLKVSTTTTRGFLSSVFLSLSLSVS